MRKRTRNIVAASAAVLAAALIAFPAAFALVPGSVSRYIDEDHFSGEVVTDTTTNSDHGGHEGWVDLNATQTNTVDGVSWSGTSCEITASGKFFLSADLDANITIKTDSVTVDLCLNGYALSAGYASGTTTVVLGVSDGTTYSDAYTSAMNIYDCGGGKSVHYYKYREDAVIGGETFHTGYDFSSTDSDGNEVNAENCDGYVRGGLITGGSNTSTRHSGGVMVGNGCTLNMYGGTIAGNISSAGAGVMAYSGTFTMYGGTIAGNYASNTSSGYGGGVEVIAIGKNGNRGTAGTATFTMYGGRICDNYSAYSGGGVTVRTSSSSPNSAADATFTMYGGVISGNVCHSNGGGVLVDGQKSDHTATFEMKGGTIRNNVSGNVCGGVYAVESYCAVTVTDGEITGNRENRDYPSASSVRGGGLCINSSGTLTISGSPYIYGNYSGGKVCNLGLASGSSYRITLDGLAKGARIGVTKAGASSGTQITTNYEEGAEAYFLSDERAYRVTANGSSYLQLTSK